MTATARRSNGKPTAGRPRTAAVIPTVEAEAQVIGAMLTDPTRAAELVRRLRQGDFLAPDHGAVFALLRDMLAAGTPIDHRTVMAALPGLKCWCAPEDADAYLRGVLGDFVRNANNDYYAAQVLDASQRRQLIDAAELLRERGEDPLTPTTEALGEFGAMVGMMQAAFAAADAADAYTVGEFLALELHDRFLIEDAIVAGQPGLFAAKSKTLKTTLALDAALSIATGRPFLDTYRVPEALPCGIISAESGGATLQETLRRIARAKGLDPRNLGADGPRLHISTRMRNLREPEGLAWLEGFIRRRNLACLFVDPAYKALPAVNDASLSEMSEPLFHISDVVDRTGCSIILVHHAKKTNANYRNAYAPPTAEDISGVGWHAWARFLLMVGRRREWNPETGEHFLHLRTEGSAGFGTAYHLNAVEGKRRPDVDRVWQTELMRPADAEAAEADRRNEHNEAARREALEQVAKVLKAAYPERLTARQVRTRTGMNGNSAADRLNVLVDDGLADVTEEKRRGSKELVACYALTPEAAAAMDNDTE